MCLCACVCVCVCLCVCVSVCLCVCLWGRVGQSRSGSLCLLCLFIDRFIVSRNNSLDDINSIVILYLGDLKIIRRNFFFFKSIFVTTLYFNNNSDLILFSLRKAVEESVWGNENH